MYKCPLCQYNLIKTTLPSGSYLWGCDNHGVAIAVGVLQKYLSEPALPASNSDFGTSFDNLQCAYCSTLMRHIKIFKNGASYAVATCLTCRFYWLDQSVATIILPERNHRQNMAHQKEIALATSAFENKSNTEEMRYQKKFTENLLQFLLLLPVTAKKAFVKPLLKLALWLYRLR